MAKSRGQPAPFRYSRENGDGGPGGGRSTDQTYVALTLERLVALPVGA